MPQSSSEIWLLNIYEEPFDAIQNLGKEVEGRVPDKSTSRKYDHQGRRVDKNYDEMEDGDILQFNLKTDSGEEVQDWGVIISYNQRYEDVRAMMEGKEVPKIRQLKEFYLKLTAWKRL